MTSVTGPLPLLCVAIRTMNDIGWLDPVQPLYLARCGEEGLSLMARNVFSAVLVEEKLPDMSYPEFLQRARKTSADAILIVSSVESSISAARQAFHNGADDYLDEPITPGLVQESIASVQARRLQAQARSDFLALWAHEARNPLTAIQTSAQVLAGGYLGPLNPEQRVELATILRNCGYLADMVDCHMDWARLELQHPACEARAVDWIEQVIEPVLQRPEYRDNAKSMTFRLTGTDIPRVAGNRRLLQIVVNNLVNNAIKYGRDHSEIRLDLSQQGDRVILGIHNTGCPLSRHDIETRLFQPFVRLKPEGSEGVKGTGLGLYLCQRIVRQHGGDLTAHSGPGDQVEFRISLPKASLTLPADESLNDQF